ncbi:hypothetical protein RKE38_16325 [Phycicoccus sp. M110.8]|uniref:hypothetical protein n=1 Tax=Phycicoccus sp. M110.8 TaxID=3075433 RepID=UPI0028FD99DA|nr:hypothetical protein [Phycicoccus sp. M110.8]MDU0315267.1 hypothetical protein [Phycicoccus sp. M110.8]
MTPESTWTDPSSAWWAKHAHAREHWERLDQAEREYMERKPFNIKERNETGPPIVVEFEFHEVEPPPVAISLVLGDIVHNLRSALDSLLLSIVSYDLGRQLTEDEERQCQWPICATPAEFERFFEGKARRQIFSTRMQGCLRYVQPFYWLEQAQKVGSATSSDLSWESEAATDSLYVLQRLSNLDKHRRLTVTAVWPSLLYWINEAGSEPRVDWRYLKPPPWSDGDVIGRMTIESGPSPRVVQELVLVALESPAHDHQREAHHSLTKEVDRLIDSVAMRMSMLISDYTCRTQGSDVEEPHATSG